jgi:hypothetical protein
MIWSLRSGSVLGLRNSHLTGQSIVLVQGGYSSDARSRLRLFLKYYKYALSAREREACESSGTQDYHILN